MDLTDEELSGVEQAGGEVELAGGAGGGSTRRPSKRQVGSGRLRRRTKRRQSVFKQLVKWA